MPSPPQAQSESGMVAAKTIEVAGRKRRAFEKSRYFLLESSIRILKEYVHDWQPTRTEICRALE